MNKEFHKRLAKNILNSPFSSANADHTETGLTENYLYFIRQLHNPIQNVHIESSAYLFETIITPDEGVIEPRRKELLHQYEQYFARIELFNTIIHFEATIRQLINTHLSKIEELTPSLKKWNLITENDSISSNIFLFLKHFIIEKLSQGFLPKKIESLLNFLKNDFLEPLVAIRHGIAHGTIRGYINARNKLILPENNQIKYQTAQDVYDHIDAASYFAISKNFGILHRVTYEWLLYLKNPGFETNLIQNIKWEASLLTKGIAPYLIPDSLSTAIKQIENPVIQRICLDPANCWVEFLQETEKQIS